MLQPDADLLETNVQLNLLNFRHKFNAKLHVAGRSAVMDSSANTTICLERSMPSSSLAGSTAHKFKRSLH